VCYSPRKRPKYAKTTNFDDVLKSCTRGHDQWKSARNTKTVCYSPRKRTKYVKTTNFDDVLKSCTGGHEQWKSARNTKTVCYSPRKRQNMRKRRVLMTRSNHLPGARTVEIGSEHQKCVLQPPKTAKKCENN
jgi:hypothetical protein